MRNSYRRYVYAIYFTWRDGFRDTFNVESASERDSCIKDMIQRKEFQFISWCRIYANGEYGVDHVVYSWR